MNNECEIDATTLVKTVRNWHSARRVFSAFIAAHPELGLKDTPVTYRNFCFRFGEELRRIDVMRKPYGLRSPAIMNSERFDAVAFELLTNRSVRVSSQDTGDEQ
jgi:hypothetical protein